MTPPSGLQTDPSHGMAGLAAVQSEQLFRAMFEQAAVGMALIETATGCFLRVNQRYSDIVGLSRDDMTATTFMAITHPDDLQADLSNMEELKAGRIHNFSMEKRYFRSDGSVVWVDLTVSPLWGVGEQPSFHIAVVQDITERKQAEQNFTQLHATLEQQVVQRTRELEESRQRLQAIVDGTSDAVFVKDLEGRYLLFNHAAGRFVGKRQDEVIGRDDRFIFSSADAQAVMEADRRVMTGGVVMTYEDLVTTADGVQRTFLSTKGPLFDGQGRVTGLFGISRDITERKLTENAWRRSQYAMDQALDAIYWIDSKARILYVNDAACAMLGYSKEEFASMTVHDLNPDFQADMWPGFWAETRQRRSMTFETFHRTKARRLLPIEIRVNFLAHEGQEFHCAFVRDITERKQAEKALRESEERFRSIFEHAGTGIAITDLEGRFLRCNPAYCALFGYTEAELHELTFKQVVHPADLAGNLVEVDRLHAQEAPSFEIENRSRHKDGHDVWVHKFVSLLRDDSGQPANMFTLVTDVTERHRMQEVLEQRVAERTEALRVSEAFNREVLDSLSAHVAVLDASGVIVAVNRVWEKAARCNDPLGRVQVGLGANYLTVCERAAGNNSEVRPTVNGIAEVLAGRKNVFETEYRCDWPGHQQWFSMRVTPLNDRGGCVIAHEEVTGRRLAEDELRDSYERLQVLSREVQVAKERERSRLSRELHDEFGQVLSGLKFDLIGIAAASAKKRFAPAEVIRTRVMRALGMVDRLFGSLRGMVSTLRPSLLEKLGLVPALESLATDIGEQSDLRCRVVVDRVNVQVCCGLEVESAIYRIAQELLTNVTRHAKATAVTITLSCIEGTAKLIVQDDGCGFTVGKVPSKGRFGLQGIRERAELLGGTVDIHSRPGKTAVTVCLSLAAPSRRDGAAVPSRLPISAAARKKRRHGKAR